MIWGCLPKWYNYAWFSQDFKDLKFDRILISVFHIQIQCLWLSNGAMIGEGREACKLLRVTPGPSQVSIGMQTIEPLWLAPRGANSFIWVQHVGAGWHPGLRCTCWWLPTINSTPHTSFLGRKEGRTCLSNDWKLFCLPFKTHSPGLLLMLFLFNSLAGGFIYSAGKTENGLFLLPCGRQTWLCRVSQESNLTSTLGRGTHTRFGSIAYPHSCWHILTPWPVCMKPILFLHRRAMGHGTDSRAICMSQWVWYEQIFVTIVTNENKSQGT